ncbi:2-amino-3-ketobutyrate coenzyme a ligase, partial [Operophtera brumata]
FNGQNVRHLHDLHKRESSGLVKLREVLEDRLHEIKRAKTWKHERVLTSPQDRKELEQRLSQFHGREDTILYASCFDANAGLFESMLTPEDAVFSDALNHASIIDGIRLCKAQKFRYPHRDLNDGVFSMDGTVAPINGLRELADKYRALLAVDDSHATGFFGETGRGTEEFCVVLGAADIICSTLGKAVGGASGGYTTGPKELVTLLRNVSRPYLFSNSPPPAVVAASLKSLDLVESSSQLRPRLRENTRQFRDGMKAAGLTVAGDDHPICPVMVGEAPMAVELSTGMLKRGIYVVAFSYPVVPKGAARVRVQLSAAHTPDDVTRAVNAFADVAREIGLVKKST